MYRVYSDCITPKTQQALHPSLVRNGVWLVHTVGSGLTGAVIYSFIRIDFLFLFTHTCSNNNKRYPIICYGQPQAAQQGIENLGNLSVNQADFSTSTLCIAVHGLPVKHACFADFPCNCVSKFENKETNLFRDSPSLWSCWRDSSKQSNIHVQCYYYCSCVFTSVTARYA